MNASEETVRAAGDSVRGHLRHAIQLNRWRMPRYARLTGGESQPISRRLIRLERLALPIALVIDWRARRYQRAGIRIVLDDFVSMDHVPPFRERTDRPSRLPGAFSPPRARPLARRIRRAYRADGFAGADRALADALRDTGATPCYGCLFRHVLESALRIVRLAPRHARRATEAGLPSTERLSWTLVRLHLALLGRSIVLDRRAAPIQARGIPILCRDVPAIPLPPTLEDAS